MDKETQQKVVDAIVKITEGNDRLKQGLLQYIDAIVDAKIAAAMAQAKPEESR